MTFPILGGNSAVSGYSIDNSLRFNDGDSPKLALSSFSPLYTFSSGTWSLWLKRSHLGTDQYFFSSHVQGGGDNKGVMLRWTDDYKIRILVEDGNNYLTWETSALFRDVSAWYHIHVIYSGSNIMDESNWTLKVNGVTQSGTVSKSGSQSTITLEGFAIGARYANSAYYLDGYATEYYFIDGSVVDVSNFAEADTDSGIWKPKEYTGTYGSKGFYLDFENSGSLGADQSGNGNNFTPTNLASTDQTTDTPTNNWCTLNPLDTPSGSTFSEGNLKIDTSVGQEAFTRSTIGVQTGKWYFEAKITTSNVREAIGIYKTDATLTDGTARISYYSRFGHIQKGNDLITTGATFGNGDIIGTAFDLDASTVSFYKNGSLQGTVTSIDSSTWTPMFQDASNAYACGAIYNFGNPPTGFTISSGNSDDNGYGNFEYAPPSGYLALCTQNLATELSPTIDDGSQYFNTVLWSGNAVVGTSITGVNFQPDWTWIKSRSTSGAQHVLVDSNRGSSKVLETDTSDAEYTNTNAVESFDSDGFTLGNDGYTNTTGRTYVGWNWLANGGTTSSNTDGSITSTVQTNTTAGFSIVTYTGTGANATVGHGLGKSLDMILVKNRSASGRGWVVWHNALAGNEALELNTTDAKITSATSWNSTVPTSSVFSVGTRVGTNESSQTFVAYCFAEIEGYSKFGSGTGSGTASTNFIYTGFKPSWVMIKRTDSTDSWAIFDNKRPSYNVTPNRLFADLSNAESTSSSNQIDMVSNGFVARGTSMTWNASGSSFIYMAFAENPFVTSTGIPVTAR